MLFADSNGNANPKALVNNYIHKKVTVCVQWQPNTCNQDATHEMRISGKNKRQNARNKNTMTYTKSLYIIKNFKSFYVLVDWDTRLQAGRSRD
jgi:hypothetical protein